MASDIIKNGQGPAEECVTRPWVDRPSRPSAKQEGAPGGEYAWPRPHAGRRKGEESRSYLLARNAYPDRRPAHLAGAGDGVERGDLKPKSGGTLRELSCLEVTKKKKIEKLISRLRS